MLINLVYYALYFISFLITIFTIVNIFNSLKIMRYVEKFDTYISVLHYHMKKTYQIIYRDKLLVFSMEAIKVKEEDLKNYSKEFVSLLILSIGPSLYKIFIEIYGNEETFFKNAIDFFLESYDGDEIRESATDELINKE